MPARLHTIVLCVTLDSQSATAWKKNTWSVILWRIRISVLCVVNDSSPGTINSETWRVMLVTICIYVLYVTKKSFQETTHRHTIKVMLWITHIHVLSVSRNSSLSTTQRDIETWIMGNSISLFGLISKNYRKKYSALVTSTADKKHHGNTLLHKVCNTELFAAGENW